MLYLFDLDGTLMQGYMDRADKDFSIVEVLPGRKERLAFLLAEGDKVGIVTNQAGVAFGFVTEDDFYRKMEKVLDALGLISADIYVSVCFAHEKATVEKYRDPAQVARRKPSGKMIEELVFKCADSTGYVETLFVGDRPEDQQAAADAHCGFMWSDDFFAASVQWIRELVD